MTSGEPAKYTNPLFDNLQETGTSPGKERATEVKVVIHGHEGEASALVDYPQDCMKHNCLAHRTSYGVDIDRPAASKLDAENCYGAF